MRITPTRQRNAVSEGMALGLFMCGRVELPYDKLRVDLSFTGAWRSWQHAQHFPQVTTDINRGLDGVLAMTRADANKNVWNFYWDRSDGVLTINLRSQWSDVEINEDEMADGIDGGVPAISWCALAEDFLRRFDN